MLDFFKDIFSAFRQSSLERIKSPFLGAFVFSWIGFNWQMLAILFFSKQNIIGRLEYINSHFDVGSYILGPMSTTILICLLLPYANKHVTKFQKGTNHETNMLILQSKIDIANKQVEIADYEAKKKLAEDREKKNIESNINVIIDENKNLKIEIKEKSDNISLNNVVISKLNDDIDALKRESEIAKVVSEKNRIERTNLQNEIEKLKSEIEKNNKISSELLTLKNQNDELSSNLIHTTVALNKRDKDYWEIKGELNEALKKLASPKFVYSNGLASLGNDHSNAPENMVEALSSASYGLANAANQTKDTDRNQ